MTADDFERLLAATFRDRGVAKSAESVEIRSTFEPHKRTMQDFRQRFDNFEKTMEEQFATVKTVQILPVDGPVDVAQTEAPKLEIWNHVGGGGATLLLIGPPFPCTRRGAPAKNKEDIVVLCHQGAVRHAASVGDACVFVCLPYCLPLCCVCAISFDLSVYSAHECEVCVGGLPRKLLSDTLIGAILEQAGLDEDAGCGSSWLGGRLVGRWVRWAGGWVGSLVAPHPPSSSPHPHVGGVCVCVCPGGRVAGVGECLGEYGCKRQADRLADGWAVGQAGALVCLFVAGCVGGWHG